MAFQIEVKESAGKLAVVIAGYVDEHASFPAAGNPTEIAIHLGKANGINSIGTRAWCEWIRTFPDSAKIMLDEVPVVFVKSFNRVNGAFTKNMIVRSFYVPYVNDESGERQDVLLKLDHDYQMGGDCRCPEVTDGKGTKLEVDVLRDYFRFIKP